MSSAPILYQWSGEAMVPLRRFNKRCDEEFCVGEVYNLEIKEERSQRSHAHYFASVAEAWANLPDEMAERFPSPNHLRRYALVRAGFRDERSIVCSDNPEAERVAAFVRPLDSFAVVVVQNTVVTVLTAKSQSYRAMGKVEFQRSKDAVLDVIAGLIGTTAATLSQAGEAA